jgi:hypothetical protein
MPWSVLQDIAQRVKEHQRIVEQMEQARLPMGLLYLRERPRDLFRTDIHRLEERTHAGSKGRRDMYRDGFPTREPLATREDVRLHCGRHT